VAGRPAGMYAWTRHLEKHLTLEAGQYKYTGTTPLNIPSSP